MKEIVVWGTGGAYEKFIKTFDLSIEYLVDNDKKKWGTTVGEHIVKNPEILKDKKDDYIVIVASMYIDEISNQLYEYGFSDSQIISAEYCTIAKIIQKQFLGKAYIDKSLKKCPITFIDIGCGGGISYIWKDIKGYMKIIGFEPDNRAYEDLKSTDKKKEIFCDTALYKTSTVLDFYETSFQPASSIYPINKKIFSRFTEGKMVHIANKIKMSVDTLDNQLLKNNIDDIDFIKLDTQGSELDILQGATRALSDLTLGIYVEVEFLPLYKSQPLFYDVDKFIKKFGFELFDLTTHGWTRENKFIDTSNIKYIYKNTKKQIVFGDVLYLREITELLDILGKSQDNVFKKSKILKFFIIALLYGFLDYAIEIIYQSRQRNILTQNEFEDIINLF